MASKKEPLSVTHPEVAAQAEDWDPATVTGGSGLKKLWKCNQGHTWDAVVNDRTFGYGCPYCAGQKVLAGFNDLATINPELASQAHGWNPSTVTAGSKRKLGWVCSLGHTWEATVKNRHNLKSSCPVCNGNQCLAGFNDLVTINPELASQAHGWDPSTVTAGSGLRKSWKCIEGHVWEATINARNGNMNGCPVCSGQKVLIGFNDFATHHPELASQAHGWDPSTVTAGSKKRVSWQCDLGHLWQAVVKDRKKAGCPICSGHQVLAGFNDLETVNPELASEWHPIRNLPLLPTEVTFGSSIKIWWLGKDCRHEWRTTTAGRRGCPICSGNQVLAGFNDLATVNPELASEWHPSKNGNKRPNQVMWGSPSKAWWRCTDQGHEWQATIASRNNGIGCAVCSNHAVLVGFNDLATTNPELAAQADGWDPTTLGAGSAKKVGWKCEEGHTWKAVLVSRSNGRGCPSCASSGFDPNKDGWLYFIDHDELSMFQVGISNFPETRLAQHVKRDWEVLEVRGPMEGHLAQQLELAILHAVERRGAVRGHKAEIEKFDGYSEAWTKDSLTVTSFKQLLDWVYEDDQ